MIVISCFRMTSSDGCHHYFIGTRKDILADVPVLEKAWGMKLADLTEIDPEAIRRLDLREDEREMLAVIDREKTVEPLAVHLFSRPIDP
jgi:hypothetical protein